MRKLGSKVCIMIFSILLLNSVLFVGCSKSKVVQIKDVSVKEVSNKLIKDMDMSKLKNSDEKLEKLYGIKPEEVEEFKLYIPTSNISANELTIIKVKNEEDIKSIEDKIRKRIESQTKSFKDYIPEQANLLEKNILSSKGKYILFVVSESGEKVEKSFNDVLTQK